MASIEESIANAVSVSRADIETAKSALMSQVSSENDLTVESHANDWASSILPGVADQRGYMTLVQDRGDDDAQIQAFAQWISWKFAYCAAADELARAGVVVAVGSRAVWNPSVSYRSSHGAGGFTMPKRLRAVFPERLFRPSWIPGPFEVLDADVFLQHLGPLGHSGIGDAVGLSLRCFRASLYVPCLAMLGAASEGAWIQLGRTLGRGFPGTSATTLLAKLDSRGVSTEDKIDRVADFYRSNPSVDSVRRAARVSGDQLKTIADWSHVLREARNVLHWDAQPALPNTYEKVAVLLMTASGYLSDLARITATVPNPPSQ